MQAFARRHHGAVAAGAAAAVLPPMMPRARSVRRSTSSAPARCSSCAFATLALTRSAITPTLSTQSLLLRNQAPRASITTTSTSSSEFSKQLTRFLDCLQLLLESSRFEAAGLDVNLADGVLSVSSATQGTWVLNKHGPTRQLWLSSPVSGPRKFNFHGEASAASTVAQAGATGEGWLSERDETDELKARLIREWTTAFGVAIDPVEDFMHEDE